MLDVIELTNSVADITINMQCQRRTAHEKAVFIIKALSGLGLEIKEAQQENKEAEKTSFRLCLYVLLGSQYLSIVPLLVIHAEGMPTQNEGFVISFVITTISYVCSQFVIWKIVYTKYRDAIWG